MLITASVVLSSPLLDHMLNVRTSVYGYADCCAVYGSKTRVPCKASLLVQVAGVHLEY